jgi:SAM-dependent methyltransferase
VKALGALHGRLVFDRRIRVLANRLAPLIPAGSRILDVGCGDGRLDRLLQELREDLTLEGVDVLVRPDAAIPVRAFDGTRLPCDDRSFDVVMFVDVLHHTPDPVLLLREAARVARRAVLIKDHCRDGLLAGPTLRLMDWVGNAPHGVALPYNYWPEARWRETFGVLALDVETWIDRLALYPWPLALLFERRLHFIARLRPPAALARLAGGA